MSALSASEQEMSGYIYFLVNPSMPGLVKIGQTGGGVDERVKQLNSTSVPVPFEVVFCIRVRNAAELERRLHNKLVSARLSKNREFFQGSPKDLLEVAFPLLIDEVPDESSPSTDPDKGSNFVSDIGSRLLNLLMGRDREYGYHVSAADFANISELEIEYEFSKLKVSGYVSERRVRTGGWDRTLWRITSEGVKFAFDHGLVDDSVRNPTCWF